MSEASPNPPVHVVRVFCDGTGRHGNPLGVVLDGAAVPTDERRQRVAHALGFSETVFIDDAARGVLQIFTPTEQLPLAGHPLVGTAWLLAALRLGALLGRPIEIRQGIGSIIRAAAATNGQIRVHGRVELAPPRSLPAG